MTQNARTVNLVIFALAFIAWTCIVGFIYLIHDGKPVPNELWAIPVGAVSAIGAILSSTHSAPQGGQPVTITNKTDDPVPTKDV